MKLGRVSHEARLGGHPYIYNLILYLYINILEGIIFCYIYHWSHHLSLHVPDTIAKEIVYDVSGGYIYIRGVKTF